MSGAQGNETLSDLPTPIGNPARRALIQAGCIRLEQLADLTEREVSQMHGVGPKAIRELRAVLAERGLSFAVDASPVRRESDT